MRYWCNPNSEWDIPTALIPDEHRDTAVEVSTDEMRDLMRDAGVTDDLLEVLHMDAAIGILEHYGHFMPVVAARIDEDDNVLLPVTPSLLKEAK